ncbi:glycoside hydrolase family 28 protein [Fulvivirga sp. M361]|uniref:glycoside hydrolase family 28 protein n=1 Tax=Fulvivirga sp. M361 TaxID=2594266 RepID=UPI001179E600|nr:glycoside hydrolase family 28 protein [Fulvivirga sp. M361]TRX52068.1 glycoside hydrolase family 28 protein [Fulvivirga sp. M361]
MIKALLCLSLLLLCIVCTTPQKEQQKAFTLEIARAYEAKAWNSIDSLMARINPPQFRSNLYDVKLSGAKGDSITNDLPVFMQAINKCSEEGGGTVRVPAGQFFLKGPIHLRSNVNLHLDKGARIFFSQEAGDYLPVVKVRWEGTVCYNYSPLIYAYRQTNIAITGEGVIDGAAAHWSEEWRKLQKPDKKRLRQMGNDTIPDYHRVFGNGFMDADGDGNDDGYGDAKSHYLRPGLIEFYECNNVLLEGFTAKNSPFWTVHPIFSKNITIRNLKVFGHTLNDDGIDPDSCEDVLIEGCTVQTHDDAIAVKAGRDQDAWIRPASRNIIIRNNQLMSGVNALCIGSEMSGGVFYMFAENNTISDGKHALNFKCNLDRGGQVENIFIRNTTISSCREAMFIFRMDYHGYRGNHFPTAFNDFYVSDITCGNVEMKPFKIVGVPDQFIKRIYLNNIKIRTAGENSEFQHTEDLLFSNVTIAGRPFTSEND